MAGTKDDIIEQVQASADGSGDLELRLSLGDPTGGPLVIRGVTRELGIAYAEPGFIDSLLQGIADVIDARVPVFGRDPQQAYTAGPLSTTSSTFQAVATLTTPALTGTYRVGWSAVVQTTGSAAGETRLYNVTNAVIVGRTVSYLYNPAFWVPVGGFAYVVFTGASKQFQIQYRSPSGVNTQSISEANLELWRVA
jgi:hypothetical protein